MIERKSALEQPEINRSGILGIKVCKLLVEDGNELDCQWHRTSIPIDADPAAQMAAVNEHLVSMGYPPVPQADIDFAVQCHALMVQRYGAGQ